MVSFSRRWLESWLHQDAAGDLIALQDGRVLVALVQIATLIIGAFGFVHMVTGNLLAMCTCSLSAALLLLLLLRISRSPNIDGLVHAFLAISVFSITSTAAVAGEQRWLILLFLAFVPTAPAALMELRDTLVWDVICLLCGSLIVVSETNGWLPAVNAVLPWQAMYWMTFFSMLVYSSIAGFVVQRSQRLLLFRSEIEEVGASEAERTRTRFLANVSHELRTPLHGLLGTADGLLRGDPGPAATREGLEIIRSSADTLLALVNDLLALTRSEQTRLEPVVFRPTAVVDEVVSLYKAMAEERGLRVEARTAGLDGRGGVLADRRRIVQVLSNLVSNAIKYSRKGAVVIEARAERGVLIFTVSDAGPGIPPEVQSRLFERFVLGSDARREESTGLGLSISRSITRDLGGELALISTGPEGSTFRVVIPAKEVTSPDITTSIDDVLPDLGGLRVLLAEDHPVNQRVTSMMARRLGAVIDVASNGREAVEALRARSYDALLLDWFMPELDGAGVLQAIQREGHQVYVIVMSAQVDPDGFMELRHAGAHAFLAKPCGLTELCDALMDAPRRPRAPAPAGGALPIRAVGQA